MSLRAEIPQHPPTVEQAVPDQQTVDLQSHLQDESGLATYLTGFALTIALLALMLIYIPWMGLHTSRRIAQNGTDAAAHAAAGFYADSLTGRFPLTGYTNPAVAFCTSRPGPSLSEVRDQTRYEAVQLFQRYYEGFAIGAAGAARAEASNFARQNKTDHVASSFRVGIERRRFSDLHHRHRDTGITLYPIRVHTEVLRDYVARTGHVPQAPGFASAVAYIDDVDRTIDMPIPSSMLFENFYPFPPCTSWLSQYDYKWQVRIVDKD